MDGNVRFTYIALMYIHQNTSTHLVVVGAGEEVGLVAARVVVDAVHALLVALQGEVRGVRAQAPHLSVADG